TDACRDCRRRHGRRDQEQDRGSVHRCQGPEAYAVEYLKSWDGVGRVCTFQEVAEKRKRPHHGWTPWIARLWGGPVSNVAASWAFVPGFRPRYGWRARRRRIAGLTSVLFS